MTPLKTKITDNIDLKAITIFARTVFCLGLRVGHRGHRAWAKDKAGHSPLTLGPAVWRGEGWGDDTHHVVRDENPAAVVKLGFTLGPPLEVNLRDFPKAHLS